MCLRIILANLEIYLYITIISIGITHIKLIILINCEVKVINSITTQTKASNDLHYSFTVRY